MTKQSLDKKQPGPFDVLKSVLMSFLGVQRESVRLRDFQYGRPRDFILAGLLVTVLFVGALIALVKLVLLLAGVPADG